MQKGLSRFQVIFMMLTCAFVVGNLYYNQPLLGILARDFGVSEKEISIIPAFTLIGYALGILFLVPLGDMLERKKLLQVSMSIAGLFAIALTWSPSVSVLATLSFLMGFCNISGTVLIPFSANLAHPSERGKVVGVVLSGILLGSLMARTVAGFMADNFGWRSVFLLAGAVNFILAIMTQWALPSSEASFKGSYKNLLISSWHLVRDYGIVREAAIMGAILFGSFSAFWTTLTFLLEGEPFHYSAQTIGLFGILGMIGALAAPLAGRYSDKKGAAATIRLGLYFSMGAFALLAASSHHIWGVIIGVLLLDLGIQVAHISNQARLFSLSEDARSRLSSIYIFAYFVGGSLGSIIGSQLWAWGKWPAVSMGGLVFCLVSAVIFYRGQKIRRLLPA